MSGEGDGEQKMNGGEYLYTYQGIQFDILNWQIENKTLATTCGDKEEEFIRIFNAEVDRVKRIIECKLSDFKLAVHSLQLKLKLNASTLNCIYLNVQDAESTNFEHVLGNLINHLISFEHFVRVNTVAIDTIVRKHDMLSGIRSTWFEVQQIHKCFTGYLTELDALALSISDAYSYLRESNNQQESVCQTENQTERETDVRNDFFERKSAKFWIAPEHVFAVKMAIIQHLPQYIYKRSPAKR